MIRYIQAASDPEAGKLVNTLGKYLKKNLDGAFSIKFGPMTCEVKLRMYYQIPEEPDTLDEMQFFLDITSYQGKIRLNITEDTNLERTIGQIILSKEEASDLKLAQTMITKCIKDSISKTYLDYDFIY